MFFILTGYCVNNQNQIFAISPHCYLLECNVALTNSACLRFVSLFSLILSAPPPHQLDHNTTPSHSHFTPTSTHIYYIIMIYPFCMNPPGSSPTLSSLRHPTPLFWVLFFCADLKINPIFNNPLALYLLIVQLHTDSAPRHINSFFFVSIYITLSPNPRPNDDDPHL